MRSRNADAQESWKDGGDDRSDSKNLWADSGEPRAASPGSVTQYNKTGPSQDFPVRHAALFYCLFLEELIMPLWPV